MSERKAGSVITTVILIIICIALAGAVIMKMFEPKESVDFGLPVAENADARSNVYVKEITQENFVRTLKFYGTASDDADRVSIITRTGGYVSEILVDENDRVDEGQVIGYIDPSTPGSSYKKYAVNAKISGTVESVNVTVGSYVAASTVFATEKEDSSYVVKLNLPERYIDNVHIGSKAVLTSSVRSSLNTVAYVTDISSVIDSASRTVVVTLKPEDDSLFLDGLALTVRLVIEEEDGVFTVPSDAVSTVAEKSYVYVVEDGKASLREVTLGSSNDTDTVILTGLRKGDTVVVEGTVTDGASVNIVER